MLETIGSGGAIWTNTYNRRRLNESESLAYGGYTYNIRRAYDANAGLATLTYPDNKAINYSPNALGQASRVGGYATAIRYYPNGAVASFTYGNGVARTLLLNVRGLPQRSTDAGVLDETYTYDRNGNTGKIDDAIAARTMTYDGLDRLRTVAAPNLWGTATYKYDALDNLVSSTISAGANVATLVHHFDATTNRLTSMTGGPAAFNFGFQYDAQGNITRRGTQTYVFDLGNRLSSATNRASYAYDGLGHRISTVGTDGVNTVQVYTQAGKLLYSGPPGSGGTKYVYLNNHVIAEVK